LESQLTPAERQDENCGIFAQDYGQAGAIDFLGRNYGLPRSLSGHQTWFLWGPRGYSGNCMIVLDDRRERLEQLWEHVDYVGTSADNPYALEKEIPSTSAAAQNSATSRTSGQNSSTGADTLHHAASFRSPAFAQSLFLNTHSTLVLLTRPIPLDSPASYHEQ
jgi:hypothetical protein